MAVHDRSSSGPAPTAAPGGHLSQTIREFLAKQIAPLRWVVPGLIPEAGLILLAGHQKLGKSMFAMDTTVAVAAGQPVLGRPVLQGPTLYVLEEGAPAGVADRYRRIAARRGTPDDAHLVLRQGLRTDDQRRWGALREEVARIKPVLIVLDPLVRLHRADENVAGEMSRVMEALQALTAEGSAVVVVHHVVKHGSEGGGVIGNAARGSGAIISSTDGNLVLGRKGGHLRLETEMRDAESETIHIDYDGATANFTLREEAPREPAAPRYPGGVDPVAVAALAAARVAADPTGGLTSSEFSTTYHVSAETARQALAALVRDGYLVKTGPANRPVYRPGRPFTPSHAQAA